VGTGDKNKSAVFSSLNRQLLMTKLMLLAYTTHYRPEQDSQLTQSFCGLDTPLMSTFSTSSVLHNTAAIFFTVLAVFWSNTTVFPRLFQVRSDITEATNGRKCIFRKTDHGLQPCI